MDNCKAKNCDNKIEPTERVLCLNKTSSIKKLCNKHLIEKMIVFLKDEWGKDYFNNDFNEIEDSTLTEMFKQLNCEFGKFEFEMDFLSQLTGDNFIQVTYASTELKKNIIWNYDFSKHFDSIETFINSLFNINLEIEVFEERIKLLSSLIERGKEEEDYLFKVAKRILEWREVKYTKEELATLLMNELVNINNPFLKK